MKKKINKETVFKYWEQWDPEGTQAGSKWAALDFLFSGHIKEEEICQEALDYLGYIGNCLDIKQVSWRMNSVVNRDTWTWATNFIDDEIAELRALDFATAIERIQEHLAQEQAYGIMTEIREQFEQLEHHLA
jgi:hypothetical protein